MAAKQKGVKEICSNRKAFHEYFVLERYEAGIELFGTEVKSIRAGGVNLKDAYCTCSCFLLEVFRSDQGCLVRTQGRLTVLRCQCS